MFAVVRLPRALGGEHDVAGFATDDAGSAVKVLYSPAASWAHLSCGVRICCVHHLTCMRAACVVFLIAQPGFSSHACCPVFSVSSQAKEKSGVQSLTPSSSAARSAVKSCSPRVRCAHARRVCVLLVDIVRVLTPRSLCLSSSLKLCATRLPMRDRGLKCTSFDDWHGPTSPCRRGRCEPRTLDHVPRSGPACSPISLTFTLFLVAQ
jgi:hypothetical protein